MKIAAQCRAPHSAHGLQRSARRPATRGRPERPAGPRPRGPAQPRRRPPTRGNGARAVRAHGAVTARNSCVRQCGDTLNGGVMGAGRRHVLPVSTGGVPGWRRARRAEAGPTEEVGRRWEVADAVAASSGVVLRLAAEAGKVAMGAVSERDEKHSAAGGAAPFKGGRRDACRGGGPGRRAMRGAKRGRERGGLGAAGTAQRCSVGRRRCRAIAVGRTRRGRA
jgi:hypothetical protein